MLVAMLGGMGDKEEREREWMVEEKSSVEKSSVPY
jgi:hypothetical protein